MSQPGVRRSSDVGAGRTFKVLVSALAVLLLAGCAENSPTRSSTATSSPSVTPPSDVLPAAQAYVDAVARRDLEGLVNAFRPDARIVDVSRTIIGHDAIRIWADNEVVGGTLRVLAIIERRPDGQKLLVHWAPAGSDGFRAHYDFTVRDDRIVAANLQYA